MDIEFKFEKKVKVIAELNESIHTEHVLRNPDVFNPFDIKAIKKWFKVFFEKEDSQCVIAYLDDKPVGYTLFKICKNDPSNPFVKEDYEWIQIDQLSINESFRNKGIGEKMMKFISEIGAKENIKRIKLDVWSNNLGAKKFYSKLGFNLQREILELKIN
jgi:ribosomal protein S18 acetylase RimI-like enzyme